jgi:hypothetical protein
VGVAAVSAARVATDAVQRLAAENEQLDRRNAELLARVAELEDAFAASETPEVLRAVYRRGYNAGHHAGKRGKLAALHPDTNVRGDLRRLLSAA